MEQIVPAFRPIALTLAPLLFFWSPPSVRAQEAEEETEPPAATTPADSNTTGEVREAKPEVFYLKDKNGNLVPVPDFSFERYEELVQLEILRSQQQPPQFSFTDIVLLSGSIERQHAVLDASFSIRLIDDQDEPREGGGNEWVRIPLRLHQTILAASPKYEGEGETFLEFREDGDGYVAWIRAAPGSTHRITLTVKVPITRSGGESRVSLQTARTPTQLVLNVDGTLAEGQVGNSEENVLTTSRIEDRATRFTVESSGGTLDLSWREREPTQPMLQATGTLAYAINGTRIECDAKLKLHSHGAPQRSFVVRLPPGMELKSTNVPGLRVTLENGGSQNAPEPAGQRVRVERLDGATSNPLEVQLLTQRPPELEETRTTLELGGFEVIGASRQDGTVDFAVEGEWELDWTTVKNVRRVDHLDDSQSPQKLAARFVYYRQPFSLKLDLQPRQTQIRVDPRYVFYIEPNQVRLDATLQYKVSGVRAKQVRIDLDGWIVDQVEPQELISGSLSLEEVGPLTIPLATDDPLSLSEFELRIQAHQSISQEEQPFRFKIPQPQDGLSTPATVIVAPADNIELVAQTEDLQGLLPESLPSDPDLSDRQQPPITYREEPSAEGSAFVGSFQLRQRAVSAAVYASVKILERSIQVDQHIHYQVSYEPLHKLVFDIPHSLLENELPKLVVDQQELPLSPPVEDSEIETETLRVTAELPEPRIGNCEVTLEYTIPLDELAPDATEIVTLPLPQPAEDGETSVSRSTVQVTAAENAAVVIEGEAWTLDAEQTYPESSSGTVKASAEGRQSNVALSLTFVQPRQRRTTVIHKAWLQTWLSAEHRRDRATFRLACHEQRLRICLPAFAHTDGVEVFLSGQSVHDFVITEERYLLIDLDDETTEREFTIELFYWFAVAAPPLGRLTAEMPAISGADRATRAYWQLVLPRNECLLWSSPDLTREVSWQWLGFGWGRRGDANQRELEDWVGAAHQDPLPRDMNRYLFSSVGSIAPRQFVTGRLHIVLLVVSGVALAIGLLLIYYPMLRHPASLFVGGVVFLSVGLLYPDPAVLAAQAAALGIALVLVARLLEWMIARRRHRRSIVRGASYSAPDSKVGEKSHRLGEGSTGITTIPARHAAAADPQP
ncbi:MAG: hypothetical protein ACC628_01575 [Pirellulaceae bacterium]